MTCTLESSGTLFDVTQAQPWAYLWIAPCNLLLDPITSVPSAFVVEPATGACLLKDATLAAAVSVCVRHHSAPASAPDGATAIAGSCVGCPARLLSC